jgi:hypothetical protein
MGIIWTTSKAVAGTFFSASRSLPQRLSEAPVTNRALPLSARIRQYLLLVLGLPAWAQRIPKCRSWFSDADACPMGGALESLVCAAQWRQAE